MNMAYVRGDAPAILSRYPSVVLLQDQLYAFLHSRFSFPFSLFPWFWFSLMSTADSFEIETTN